MLFATIGQGALFLWMMACGVVIGAWYALMAGLRRFIQAGFWLTLICDLAFGVGAAVIFMLFAVAGDYGRVRPFAVLAAFMGAMLFALAFGPSFSRIQAAAVRIWRSIAAAVSGNRLIKVIFK